MTQRRPIVYYTVKVPPEGPDLLRPFCEVIEKDGDEIAPKNGPVPRISDAAALCCAVSDVIDAGIMSSFPQLRIIAVFARGYDNVDVDTATQKGIWVAQVSELLTEPTADLTWALLLAVARKLVPADAFVRSGQFTGWAHPPAFWGGKVFGKTLGVLGMGRLGLAIARRAMGFDMTILYYQRHRLSADQERRCNLVYVTRDELFARSDFVCLATPLTQETLHQITERELGLMKPTAYLINTARGAAVDEEQIGRALKEKRIAGYAADVFEMEDKLVSSSPPDINEALIDKQHCSVLTPHLGGAILETRIEMSKVQALNVLQAFRGERPADAINAVSLKAGLIE